MKLLAYIFALSILLAVLKAAAIILLIAYLGLWLLALITRPREVCGFMAFNLLWLAAERHGVAMLLAGAVALLLLWAWPVQGESLSP